MERLKNTRHKLPTEASRTDTDHADSIATENAEMATLVGWDVHKAGLADLGQVVPRRVPDEGYVLLAPEHVDQLLQQSPLLSAPGRAALKRFDNDAGIVSKRVGKLQLRIGHGRPPKPHRRNASFLGYLFAMERAAPATGKTSQVSTTFCWVACSTPVAYANNCPA